MMSNWDGSWSWGGWIAMVAMMVVFWGAIAWVVVTLIHQSGSRSTAPPGTAPNPIAVLDERFARGEIDEDEYRRRRDVLRGGT